VRRGRGRSRRILRFEFFRGKIIYQAYDFHAPPRDTT